MATYVEKQKACVSAGGWGPAEFLKNFHERSREEEYFLRTAGAIDYFNYRMLISNVEQREYFGSY